MDNNTNSNILGSAVVDPNGGITTSGYVDAQFCGFRLPCGYCTRLCQPCPMQGLKPQIVWTTATTSTTDEKLNINFNKNEVQC